MLISSIVANGTTAGNWGYEPWLPFYNFFPSLVIASVLLSLSLYVIMNFSLTRALAWGSIFFTSGLSACVVVFVLWVKLDLNPDQVFFWWSVNWILIMMGQLKYIHTNKRVKARLKEMEDREI